MAGASLLEKLTTARGHLVAGNLAAAETAFRDVLADAATNAEALDGLGLVLRDTDRSGEALDCFERAVNADPDYLEAHLHRAETLLEIERFDDAVIAYGRLTALLPEFAPLHAALGVARKRAGDLDGAVASYTRAEALDPGDPAIPFNLGLALSDAGRPEAAAEAYGRAAAIAPNLVEAWVNLGNLRREIGQPEAAAEAYRQALKLTPDDAATWSRLGVALDEMGDSTAALESYRKAIALDQACADAHYNLGIALKAQGDLGAAIDSYRQALAADPDQPDALYNLGLAQQADGDAGAAEASYRAALAENPDQAQARNNLGTVLLGQGQVSEAVDIYRAGAGDDPAATAHANTAWNLGVALLLAGELAEGWQWYEWRFARNGAVPPTFDVPRWHLDAPPDARVLVHAEQGYGDALHFIRYVSMVAARCGAVVLEVPPHLKTLLRGFAGAQVVSAGDRLPDFDFHMPLLSLPGVFATTLDTIPADVPYIMPPADRLADWQDRLAGPGRRVGLVWRGNPDHVNDHNRSLDPALLAPLLAAPGCQFFSLQKAPADGDWPALQGLGTVTDLAPALTDFAETAAAIAGLDLVITVDTAVAHLAGALGRPCWVLLPHVPDWRWLMDRGDSPWYPSLRLFRQAASADWPAVVDHVAAALAQSPAA